jgi:hypothetical protein
MAGRVHIFAILAVAVAFTAGCSSEDHPSLDQVARKGADPGVKVSATQPRTTDTLLPSGGGTNQLPTGGTNQLPAGGTNQLSTGGTNQLSAGGTSSLPDAGTNQLPDAGAIQPQDAGLAQPSCSPADPDAGPSPNEGARGDTDPDAGSSAPAAPEPCAGNSDNTVGLEQPTLVQYLSGHGSDDTVKWSFYCQSDVSTNRNCGNTAGPYTTIDVPANWEFQGFGTYNYGPAYKGCSPDTNEIGHYRLNFTVPEGWRGRRVYIAFEGAMTDTTVSINGRRAGAVHQGAFYCFKYDVTSLLDFGGCNVLDATVSSESSDADVNKAERCGDYWVFGGIFRPVYLEAYPQQRIDRIAADARMNGDLSVDVYLKDISTNAVVTGRVLDARSNQVGPVLAAAVLSGQTNVKLTGNINGVQPWSAETPNLYRLVVKLQGVDGSVHDVAHNIGFRTVEIRAGDGIYINDKRVLLRGINRHSFYPDTGRALNARLSYDDVMLLKGMNVNAVRSSHYPPDRHFLDTADALGLYVLDELAGWHKPYPYTTKVGTPLVQEMVAFSANHPSIIFWDNGNELYETRNLDFDVLFDYLDPQHRPVLHPNDDSFNNVRTSHYPVYSELQSYLASGDIVMPTEFMHGLFDGGGGAALDDFWSLMQNSSHGAGGFLWAFVDECVVRTDQNNSLDCREDSAPDGIVGPHREPEGSVDTIREIWSPVQISAKSFPYSFSVENRYDFTDLSQILFHWQLVDFDFGKPDAGHRTAAEGATGMASVPPGSQSTLELAIPADWEKHHALLLNAQDASQRTIGRWSWPIATATGMRQNLVATAGSGKVVVDQSQDSSVTVTTGQRAVTFSKTTGLLTGITRNGIPISLANGPTFTSATGGALSVGNGDLQSFSVAEDGNDAVVTASYAGSLQQATWRVMSNGWLALSYRYALAGTYDFFGVTFDFLESQVKRAQWLGKGPYRVWKNRMKGTTFDVWSRDYNDSTPGISWSYPEFKGYFADVFWARLLTNTQGTLHLVFDSDNTYLRLFTQADGYGKYANMEFPPTTSSNSGPGISFLQGIPAIGTKWHVPSDLGPQSQPYSLNGEVFEATVYLFVGDISEIPVP